MATVVGLLLLGLLFVGLASHLLDAPAAPDPTEGPPCSQCGWPPWSVMPCLCPEDDRGRSSRAADPNS